MSNERNLIDDPRYKFKHYIREDVSPFLKYEGWSWQSDDQDAKVWRILRTVVVNGVEYENSANDAQFVCKWSDRASYFPAPPSGGTPLYDSTAPIGITYTDGFNVKGLPGYAAYALWVMAPAVTGNTISVQVSIDGTNYIDLPDSEITVNDTDHFMWDVADVYYAFVRFKIVLTAATAIKILLNTR